MGDKAMRCTQICLRKNHSNVKKYTLEDDSKCRERSKTIDERAIYYVHLFWPCGEVSEIPVGDHIVDIVQVCCPSQRSNTVPVEEGELQSNR